MKMRCFVVFLLFLLSYVVLLYPGSTNPPIPSNWGVNIDFGRHHIVKTGRIYDGTLQYGVARSHVVSGEYGKVDVFPKILYGMISVVAGAQEAIQAQYILRYIVLPFIYLLWQPLVFLSWYTLIAKRSLNLTDASLIYLLSIFNYGPGVASASRYYYTAVYLAPVFTLLPILAVKMFNEKNRGISTIFIILVVLVYNTSYSTAWLLLLLTTGFWILATALRDKLDRYMLGPALISIVAFFINAFYFNPKLEDPIYWLRQYLEVGWILPKASEFALGQTLALTDFNFILRLANVSVFVFSSLLLFIPTLHELIKQKFRLSTRLVSITDMVLSFFLLSTITSSGILGYIAGGLGYAVSSISWFFIPLSILALISLNARAREKSTWRALMIVTSIMAFYIFSTTWSYTSNPYLIQEEWFGIQSISCNIGKDEYVFSDFKLGPPLLYWYHTGVVTTSPYREELTHSIYYAYSISAAEKSLSETIPSAKYYVMFSSIACDGPVADPSGLLKPALPGFQLKFENTSKFDKVFSSGRMWLFFHYLQQ